MGSVPVIGYNRTGKIRTEPIILINKYNIYNKNKMPLIFDDIRIYIDPSIKCYLKQGLQYRDMPCVVLVFFLCYFMIWA